DAVLTGPYPFSHGHGCRGGGAAKERNKGRPVDLDACLKEFVAEALNLQRILRNAVWDTPARLLGGYSANVKTLHGPGFALLGNAAEFLDPVFSSGVTIAMRSASMAAACLDRQLNGEPVAWERELAIPLKRGVATSPAYAAGWYDGSFQAVSHSPNAHAEIRPMIWSAPHG